MHKLPQAHPEVMVIALFLLLHETPSLLIGETLLEALEDLDIGELALGKPSLGHNAQALPQHTKGLGTVGDDDDGLLHGGSGHLGGAVDELGRVELTSA